MPPPMARGIAEGLLVAPPPIIERMLPSSSEPPTTPAAAAAAVPRNEPPPPPPAALRRAVRLTIGGLTVTGADHTAAAVLSGPWACCITWPLFQTGRPPMPGARTFGTEPATEPAAGSARRSRRASNRGSRRIDSVRPRAPPPVPGCGRGRASAPRPAPARSAPAHRRHWAPAQALHDRGHGFGIARGVLQLGKPVEKIVNQLAFLRCHGVLHRVEVPRSAGEM